MQRCVGDRPAEHRAVERIRVGGERLEIGGEEVVHGVVGGVEAEHRPLHVGQAVRSVGHPHQQRVAAGSLPPEQPRQILATGEMRHRPAGPVVPDGQVLDAELRERVDLADGRARDVGLHRRGEADPVPVADVLGDPEHLEQLVGGAGLGVQVVGHRGELDAPLPHPLDELRDPRRGPRLLPLPERQQRLDRPAELRLLREVVGRAGQIEARVEEGQVLGQHRALRVGVADVQVRVVHQVHRPPALRGEGDVDGDRRIQRGNRHRHRGRLVDGRHQHPQAAARAGPAGRRQPGPAARREDHLGVGMYAGRHLDPDRLQQTAGRILGEKRFDEEADVSAPDRRGGRAGTVAEIGAGTVVVEGRGLDQGAGRHAESVLPDRSNGIRCWFSGWRRRGVGSRRRGSPWAATPGTRRPAPPGARPSNSCPAVPRAQP